MDLINTFAQIIDFKSKRLSESKLDFFVWKSAVSNLWTEAVVAKHKCDKSTIEVRPYPDLVCS